MRPGPRSLLLAAVLVTAGCDDSPPQPGPSPDPGSGIPIRGDERLGWDQPAANATELATFAFAIYVDGQRLVMAGIRCETAAGPGGFPCTGQLPRMSPGLHTLELAAFVTDDDRVLEGPKSPPFQVNVMPSVRAPLAGGQGTPSPDVDPIRRPPARTADAAVLEPVLTGYTDIAAAAITPDGWLLVAERAGALRTASLADAGEPSALVVAGTRAGGETGSLVSVAADPDFARTRLVYVLQTAPSRDGLTWQLARYRQAGAAFGERAVLLQMGVAPAEPAGAVRVGPDGRLYVALQDETRDRPADERETLILRLEPDGTTPGDQPAGNPILAAISGAAPAFDWHPGTGALVVAAGPPDGPARLLTPRAALRRFRRGDPALDLPLTGARGVSQIAFQPSGTDASREGVLFVAARSGLLQARLDPRDPLRVLSIETLTDTPIRAVAAAPEGEVFVATADSVLRVR